jgi:outer membrane autotransporter protein
LSSNGTQEFQTFVRNLFVPNSNLLVPFSNTLTVTGFMDMIRSLLLVNGRLNVLGNFTDPNSTIIVNGTMTVGGNALIDSNSTMTVNGLLSVGGSASFTNISLLTINTGGLVTVGNTTSISTGSQATINGQLTSPQVNVNGSSLLTGAGRIVGNVVNSGTVAPGNSPGTLTITGNYTQTAGGNLLMEIASQTAFDRLVVGGTANLGGTLQVLATGFQFAYGQQFQVLQAGSITGQFASMTTSDPSNFRVRFLQNGGTGTVLIAPTSYTLVAETQNQRNVAGALNGFISATSGDRLTISTALDLLSASQFPDAFNAISPAQYENLAATNIEQTNALSQILQQRFNSVRLGGGRGFTNNGINSPLGSDSKTALSPNSNKDDILRPAPDNNWGVWVQGNGLFGEFDNVSNVPNSKFTSGGVIAGVDYQFAHHITLGAFTGYQGVYAEYSNGGAMNVNTVNFGVYATYQDPSGLYVNAIVNGGYSGYQVKRSIEFPGVNRSADSDPTGGLFSTTLDLGYDWKLGDFTITPTVAGQFTYVGITPFEETGAGSLDLDVSNQSAYSLRTSLGARIAYTWRISETISVIPSVSMLWQHEFMQDSRNIGASLDGGSGPSFEYSTAVPGRDSVYAGAGVTIQVSDRWNFNANYNADFGRPDFISNMISGGLNFSF